MTWVFNPFTGNFDKVSEEDLTGYVPYTGATTNVNLGTNNLTANKLTISLDGSPIEWVNSDTRIYGNNGAGRLHFYANGSEAMNIYGTNVGIGVTTPDDTLDIKGPATGADTVVQIENDQTHTSLGILRGLSPNIASGASTYLTVGKEASTNNWVSLAFNYDSDGSTSNYGSLGFYGQDPAIKFYPLGNVEIENNILPTTTYSQDIGSTTYRWNNVYSESIKTREIIGDNLIGGLITINFNDSLYGRLKIFNSLGGDNYFENDGTFTDSTNTYQWTIQGVSEHLDNTDIHPDKTGTETISGDWSFTGDIEFISTGADGVEFKIDSTNYLEFTETVMGGLKHLRFKDFGPTLDNSGDIGTGTYRYKDIYLAGDLSDGTDAISVSGIQTIQDDLNTHEADSINPHGTTLTQSNITSTGTKDFTLGSLKIPVVTRLPTGVNGLFVCYNSRGAYSLKVYDSGAWRSVNLT